MPGLTFADLLGAARVGPKTPDLDIEIGRPCDALLDAMGLPAADGAAPVLHGIQARRNAHLAPNTMLVMVHGERILYMLGKDPGEVVRLDLLPFEGLQPRLCDDAPCPWPETDQGAGA